jgi:hypothetical protein
MQAAMSLQSAIAALQSGLALLSKFGHAAGQPSPAGGSSLVRMPPHTLSSPPHALPMPLAGLLTAFAIFPVAVASGHEPLPVFADVLSHF